MKKIQNHIKFLLCFTLIVAFNSSCSSEPVTNNSGKGGSQNITPQNLLTKSSPQEISVMVFNVENMFDNTHDIGTHDYPYLPIKEKNTEEVKNYCNTVTNSFYRAECFDKNWTNEVVQFKLNQVGNTIKYLDQGAGPDIILMAEVENLNILNQLADGPLKGLGYSTRVLIEGPDTRGIDPAILSKFPLKGKPVLHIIPYTSEDPKVEASSKKSRGVIEATVILPNKKELTVMAVHFPSQANPTDLRKQAVEFLKAKMLEYQKSGRSVIAGGDMNIIAEEEDEYGYFSKILSQAGDVSHLVDCKKCLGSHFHQGRWSFLDIIVFGKSLKQNNLELIPGSVQVIRTPFNSKPNGTPLRFDDIQMEGVADHFPLYSRIRMIP